MTPAAGHWTCLHFDPSGGGPPAIWSPTGWEPHRARRPGHTYQERYLGVPPAGYLSSDAFAALVVAGSRPLASNSTISHLR